MKGLMVSLIIVIFAGAASNVTAAGQQSGGGAAGFRPRLGSQALGALERPGPDDSEDDVDWAAPSSLPLQDSTNTSNAFGARQSDSQGFNSPAPARAAEQNIRFDVKIDDNTIDQLRRGLKVSADVDVRDRSTNAPLPSSVVSDIAFFRNANERRDMVGVVLEPAPMDPNSRILRFEVDESQLDRIEQDAFVFSVPDALRGRFDEIEFVKVGGSVGSQRFSSNVSGGARGTEGGLATPSAGERFNTDPSSRFKSTSNPSEFARQWDSGSPQPGPDLEPGGSRFTGPYIEPDVIESRRNQVAPLNSNQDFAQRNAFTPPQNDRSALNTRDRFSFTDRETEVAPRQSPFGQPREPEGNRGEFNRPDGLGRRNVSNQRSGPTEAELQLAALKRQLAYEQAEKEKYARSVNSLQGEADRIAQQRDDMSEQLRVREASSRPVVQQSVPNRPTGYREPNSTYWDGAVGAERTFGTRREDYQSPAVVPVAFDQGESDQQRRIRELESKNERLLRANGVLTAEKQQADERLQESQRGGVQRTSRNADHFQVASASTEFDRNLQAEGGRPERGQPGREQAGAPRQRSDVNGSAKLGEEHAPVKSRGRSDLLWLLLLLLFSSGLNIFLWIHCRTLDLRYSDLADELRGMVGASQTI